MAACVLRCVVLAVFVSLTFASECLTAGPAFADVRIRNDPGGVINGHLRAFAHLRDTGRSVIIDGRCLSACTLVLGVLPRERICVTRRARLGFHAAWVPDHQGRPVAHDAATAGMMRVYPAEVRSWIRRKGGLSSRMIYLEGRELASLYRPCS